MWTFYGVVCGAKRDDDKVRRPCVCGTVNESVRSAIERRVQVQRKMTRSKLANGIDAHGNFDAETPPQTVVFSLDCKQETTSKVWDRNQIKRNSRSHESYLSRPATGREKPLLEKRLRLVNCAHSDLRLRVSRDPTPRKSVSDWRRLRSQQDQVIKKTKCA